jgi:integrase
MASIKSDNQIKKAIKDSAGLNKAYFSIEGYRGLRIRIRGDSVEFQHRYTHPLTKNKIEMTLGNYANGYSLEQARQAHRDNLVLIGQGIDPKTYREQQTAKQAHALDNTFKAVAMDWLNEQTNNPDHVLAEQTLKNWGFLLEPLIKELGSQPVDTITTPQVLKLLKQVQKTHIQKGNRVKGIASRIFAHAVINGLISHNPVTAVKEARALKPTRQRHHPALTTPADFAELLKEIEALPDDDRYFVKPVLQLLALTFARIGDVCSMKWADIDLQGKTWTFEPQKGKNRSDMVDSLVIPLAPQSIAILKRMHRITGGMDYVFYTGKRKKADYFDPQQVNKLLNNETSIEMNKAGIGKDFCGRGYFDVHSPHGFRASAKTMLMERLGYSHLLTEIQSGHKMPDTYGNTYNRMEAIKERVKMMNDWANYLDDLKAGKIDNMIYFDNAKANIQAVNE